MSLLDTYDKLFGSSSFNSTPRKPRSLLPEGQYNPRGTVTDQPANSSRERGFPERIDISSIKGANPKGDELGVPSQIMEIAGKGPGFIYERPLATIGTALGMDKPDAPTIPVIGDLLNFGGEVLQNANNLVPALINSNDVRKIRNNWNRPDNDVFWDGSANKYRTVGELKDELRKKGWDAGDIQDVLSGAKGDYDFGDHRVSEDPITDLGMRLVSDPTNLLIGTGVVTKAVKGVGFLAQLERAGVASAKVFGLEGAASAIAKGSAVGTSFKGLGSFLGNAAKWYTRGAIGLTAGEFGVLKAGEALGVDQPDDPRGGFLQDLLDFNRAALDNHPLSDHVAFSLVSAIHFPYMGGLRAVKQKVGEVQRAALGSNIRNDVVAALGEHLPAGPGRRAGVIQEIGGQGQLDDLIYHAASRLVFKELARDPVFAATYKAPIESIDEAIARSDTLHEVVASLVEERLRAGQIKSKDIVNELKDWYSHRSGAGENAVFQWDSQDAISTWTRYSDAARASSQAFLERRDAVIGLAGDVASERLASFRAYFKGVSESGMVSAQEVRRFLSRHPAILDGHYGTEQQAAWFKEILSNDAPVELKALNQRLKTLEKKYPSIKELTHESAAAERAAPRDPETFTAQGLAQQWQGEGVSSVGVSRWRAKEMGTNANVDDVLTARNQAEVSAFEENLLPLLEESGFEVDGIAQTVGAFEKAKEPGLDIIANSASLEDLRRIAALTGKEAGQDSAIVTVSGRELRRLNVAPNGFEFTWVIPSTDRARLNAVASILDKHFAGYSLSDSTGLIRVSLKKEWMPDDLNRVLAEVEDELSGLWPKDLVGDTGLRHSINKAYIEEINARGGDHTYGAVLKRAQRDGRASVFRSRAGTLKGSPARVASDGGRRTGLLRSAADGGGQPGQRSVSPAEAVGGLGRITDEQALNALSDGYHYREVLSDQELQHVIDNGGLRPEAPMAPRPDGSVSKRLELQNMPLAGNGAIRFKATGRVYSERAYGNPYVRGKVSLDQIEVYGADGLWHPLDTWNELPLGAAYAGLEPQHAIAAAEIDRLAGTRLSQANREAIRAANPSKVSDEMVDAQVAVLEATAHGMGLTPDDFLSRHLQEITGAKNLRETADSKIRFLRGQAGFHAGDGGYGLDTTLSRMTAGRGTGHFGTGVYFVSEPGAITGRAGRPLQKLDDAGYNLFRPQSPEQGMKLHDALRDVNEAVHARDTALAADKAEQALEALGVFSDRRAMQTALADAVLSAKDDLAAGIEGYADSASTRFMKAMGYDGIDVRGIKQLDNEGFGSVIYRDRVDVERGLDYNLDSSGGFEIGRATMAQGEAADAELAQAIKSASPTSPEDLAAQVDHSVSPEYRRAVLEQPAPPELVKAGLGDSSPLVEVPLTDGRTMFVPGGFEGEWSLWDAWRMKAQMIDPELLSEADRIQLYSKLFRSQSRALNDPLDMFNRTQMAILSSNTPLLNNEAGAAILRVRSMKELKALGNKTPQQLMAELQGAGIVYPAEKVGNIISNAKKIAADPQYFVPQAGEDLIQYSERIMSSIDGAGMKVGNFAAMLGDPATWMRGTMDSRMVTRLVREGRIPEDVAKRLRNVGKDGKVTYKAPNAIKMPLMVGGKRSPRPNPAVPQHLRNLPYGRKDGNVMVFGSDYKVLSDTLDQVLQVEHPGLPFHSGGGQWFLWDMERGIFEPHTSVWPGAYKLPHMTKEAIIEARGVQAEAGYFKATNKMKDLEAGKTPHVAEGFDPIHGVFWQKAHGLRGATIWSAGKTIVAIGRAADATTMPHELWHVRMSLADDAERALLKQHFGEKFQEPGARAFEKYLATGQAPTQELQGVFQRFKSWILDVYRGLRGTPLENQLNPEVKALFDRWLTPHLSDDASLSARAAADWQMAMKATGSSRDAEAKLLSRLHEITSGSDVLSPAFTDEAQQLNLAIEIGRGSRDDFVEGQVRWAARRDAAVEAEIPVPKFDGTLDQRSPEWKAAMADFENTLKMYYPEYTLKAPPNMALFYREGQGSVVATALKERTALGDVMSKVDGLWRWADWLTTPVKNSEMHLAAKKALIDHILPHGASVKDVKLFMSKIDDLAAESRIARASDKRWFNSPTALPTNFIEKAAKEVFSEKVVQSVMDQGGFARLVDRSYNRFIRSVEAKGSKASTIEKALEMGYSRMQGTLVGETNRLVSKTLYPIFRFYMDPRWWAMNYLEADIIGFLRYGRRATRWGGAKDGEISNAAFVHQTGGKYRAKLSETARDDTGWLYTRNTAGYIGKAFDVERPETTLNALRALSEGDPVLTRLRERFGTAEDDIVEGIDQMLYSFDRNGTKKTIYDEARAILGDDVVQTPGMAEFLHNMYKAHDETYQSIVSLFRGNPNRTNIERIMNSYWLFWPLSYQIKAGKWLFDFMLNRMGGRQTNALGAATYAQIMDFHREQLATNPDYAGFFEDHPELLFAAQMMVPITPGDMGVSLSRLPRYVGGELGLWGKYKAAQDPISAATALLNMGPFYSLNLLDEITQETGIKAPWDSGEDVAPGLRDPRLAPPSL